MGFRNKFSIGIILIFTLLINSSCQEEQSNDQDNNFEIIKTALDQYKTAYVSALLENGIDPNVMEEIISEGQFQKLEGIINSSKEVTASLNNLKIIAKNKLNITNNSEQEYPNSQLEEITKWSKKERLYTINRFYNNVIQNKNLKMGVVCEQPQYNNCLYGCFVASVACFAGTGWTGLGFVGCLIFENSCMGGCYYTYCDEEGEPDPNCPPTINCPIEQG